MATRILDLVASLGGPLLALVALVLAFCESAIGLDLLIPGELGLAVTGAAAAHNDLPAPVVLACAITGGIAGDCAGFWIGRRVGVDVVCRWRWTRRRLGRTMARAEDHFERHGGGSVFLGRWIGALRAVVPVVAGAGGMPFGRFMLFDVPAVVTWTTLVVLLGYRLGRPAAELVDEYGRYVSIVGLLLLVALLAYRHVTRDKRRDKTSRARNVCDCADDPQPAGADR